MMRVVVAVVLVLGLFLVVQCGGDSPGEGETVKTFVSGTAYLLGPMDEATVQVYDYRECERGRLFGESTTDGSGAFEIDLGPKYGDMLIEVSSPDGTVSALVTGVEAGDKATVAVHPVSSSAVAYACYLFGSGKRSDVVGAYERACELIFEHFGDVDSMTVPASPTNDQANINEAIILGVLIASLRTRAQEMSSSATLGEIVEVLLDDIAADGFFNGNGKQGNLRVGPTELDGDTLRPDFGSSIRHFLASEANKTHFTEQHFLDVITRIETSQSELFDSLPSTPDRNPPTVQITEPSNGATVSGVILVRAQAEDAEDNLRDVVALNPGDLSLVENEVNVFEGYLDTTKYQDGQLGLEVLARDEAGNEAMDTITMTVKNNGTVSGYVFKGFMKEATVTAYGFEPEQAEQVLASGVTDRNGYYSVEVGFYVGPILVVVTYGYYKEEALGTDVDLARGDYLSAVVPDYSPAFVQNVTISPLTTWAAEFATYLVLEEQQEPAAAAQMANDAISAHFGNVDILGTIPVDLLLGKNCDTLTDRVLYALYCAGLSQQAMEISIDSGLTPGVVVNAITLADSLAEDVMNDGVFDGMNVSVQLTQGDYDLSSYTIRTDLARSINAWLRSDKNPCAIGVEDFVHHASALAEDRSDLFPPGDPIIPIDEVGPAIEVISHVEGEPVSKIITIVASAIDNDEVKSFAITNPLGLSPTLNVISPSEYQLVLEFDTEGRSDGIFQLTYEAEDRSTNKTEHTLSLLIDNTYPEVVWDVPVEYFFLNSHDVVCSGSFTETGSGLTHLTVDVVDATVNGSNWSATIQGVVDGRKEISVEIGDMAGNINVYKRIIYVDTVAPNIGLSDFSWRSDRKDYPCNGAQGDCDSAVPAITINDSMFSGSPPVFQKFAEKLSYTDPTDIGLNNLPVLLLDCQDGTGDHTTDSKDLVVEYRYRLNAGTYGDWKALNYHDASGTFRLPVSTSIDPRIADCLPSDEHEIEIRTIDKAANAGTRTYKFHVELISGPIVITVEDFQSEASDPHNLFVLPLENCQKNTGAPTPIRCNNDPWEELFENSNTHPQGLRIAHITLRNTNPYPVRLSVPEELTNASATVWIQSSDRLVVNKVMTELNDSNFPDCCTEIHTTCIGKSYTETFDRKCCKPGPPNEPPECQTYLCVYNPCLTPSEPPISEVENILGVTLDFREGNPAGTVIQPTNGFYTLDAGRTYHLYTALNKLPTSFHVTPIFELGTDTQPYYYKHRAEWPPGPVNERRAFSRRGTAGDGVFYYEVLREFVNWERGLRFSHQPQDFHLEIGRNTSGSSFVGGTLLKINQDVSGSRTNQHWLVSHWPYE